MGLKAAVQALKKAEELKAKVTRHNDLLNNSEVWSDQQQLQTVYHQVLVLDLEYALDKKVEQELWTLGFKNHIAALQQLSRDKKNPRRSECQALLTWCLEAASGFYLTLLQELCSAFELDLPFRRRGAVYGQTKPWPSSEQLTPPHKSSCLYICQYCLVHLGDIARYRSQRKQAESFYRHAILLSPSSGQPYNQLALLEASRGDKLATVFHYVRSISVRHPFPAAATNLSHTLSQVIDNDDPLHEVHTKLSLAEFVTMFLRVHGLLHFASDIKQAELCVKSLNATFTALVATQAFSSPKLVQMTAINLYTLKHSAESFSNKQLSRDELRVKHLVLDLLAGAFSAYLLPIYTMNNDSSVLDYYALPAIKLTLDWIKTDASVLSDDVFAKRLQIWPSLCKILNSLQENIDDFDHKKAEKMPLPEDRDLQCFLPLVNSFKELDFSSEQLNKDTAFYNKLRVVRLINLGTWLSTQTVQNNVLITATKQPNSTKMLFEPANKQPDPTTEILEEIKHFNIKDPADQLKEIRKPIKAPEKRGGILKPQGSLEKAREEREQAMLLTSAENGESSNSTSQNSTSGNTARTETSKLKRTRQNVAMQALAKKVEENKQVTFQTEPIIKPSKEKPPQKNHEPFPSKPANEVVNPPKLNTNLPPNGDSILSAPTVDTSRLQQHQLSLGPTIPVSNPNEMTGNTYQNPVNQLPISFNQAQNFNRPPVNVSNVPFSLSYQNNSTNLSFHNTIPPPHNNIPFPRQQQSNIFNPTSTIAPPNQNSNFSIPFEKNTASTTPIGYPNQQAKEQYSPWQRDAKLPMPPSTWWTNNQKPLTHNYPPPQTQQNDLFGQAYSFSVNNVPNTNLGFVQDSLKHNTMDYTRPYNAGLANSNLYNNMSMWNSTMNMQSNLHMLLNQSNQQMMQQGSTPSQPFSDDVMKNLQRDTASAMTSRDANDTQNNSMPGYSLFNSNWAPNLTGPSAITKNTTADRSPSLIRQQSLFCGPGPSPLERLLEQQKQLRGSKEDT